MFRQIISRRFLSVTPRRSNLVSDLYIQQIKSFKPTPLSAQEVESSVKQFQIPAQPTIPTEEINSDLLKEYESSEVETAAAESKAETHIPEEEWFVFPEADEEHH
ncbi:ATP synthase subunit H, mitochondrial [[Candida] jaroonii]|uniref:ATP synthase subunit H, mitochondrial n=1 Tax=[Candida] jaroonii TaxID=467808 RepID=A0ACA9YD52_9ASCO|nr:ATP synthase subunit H, mitochondrial [[Candida] jaroonii]